MKQFSEPPIGIILTMPEIWFEETGNTYEQLCQNFEYYLGLDDGVWYFKKKSLPIHDILYVYVIWDKKVQYRTNFGWRERNRTKRFSDGQSGEHRTFKNTNWIVLVGPAVKAPHEIPMRGFQGFKYVTKELW